MSRPLGPRPAGASVARAALLIAVLTVLSRVTGLGRVLVFARTVGQTCLGDTYQTVNTVPNIVYEIVAGGALAGLVVPLLAGAVQRHDRDHVRQTSSALLCWALLVLVPLALLVALLAHPIAGLLLADKPGCGTAATDVGAAMLRVFAPQVPLYGMGIVLTGILQAHRRFAGPAVAPLLSSLAVIAAYLLFGLLTAPGTDVGTVTAGQQLVLSLGTTLGVLVLTGCLLVPVRWSTHIRLRPTLRFPDGVVPQALRLAGAGVLTLVAQQVAVLVSLRLGNGAGVPPGDYTAFSYAQTFYLLPWAVLAVPIATSVFPRLAGQHADGVAEDFARTLSRSIRAVLLTSMLGVAAMVALAGPVARVVVQHAPGDTGPGVLAHGIAGFGPGLVGYGLFALLTRALYARGAPRPAALATVAGWLGVVVADLLLIWLAPERERVLVLAVGNSLGMTLMGLLLLLAVRASAGAAALTGALRTFLVGLLAAVAAVAVAGLATLAWSGGGVPAALGQAVLRGVLLLAAFGAVALALARQDVRAALPRRLRRERQPA